MTQYHMAIDPLPEEDGGGFVAYFPDLPGCMSDGDSPQEAVTNALDALECWMEAQNARGATIPEPGASQLAFSAAMDEITQEMVRLSDEVEQAQRRIRELERTKPDGWQIRPTGIMQMAFG